MESLIDQNIEVKLKKNKKKNNKDNAIINNPDNLGIPTFLNQVKIQNLDKLTSSLFDEFSTLSKKLKNENDLCQTTNIIEKENKCADKDNILCNINKEMKNENVEPVNTNKDISNKELDKNENEIKTNKKLVENSQLLVFKEQFIDNFFTKLFLNDKNYNISENEQKLIFSILSNIETKNELKIVNLHFSKNINVFFWNPSFNVIYSTLIDKFNNEEIEPIYDFIAEESFSIIKIKNLKFILIKVVNKLEINTIYVKIVKNLFPNLESFYKNDEVSLILTIIKRVFSNNNDLDNNNHTNTNVNSIPKENINSINDNKKLVLNNENTNVNSKIKNKTAKSILKFKKLCINEIILNFKTNFMKKCKKKNLYVFTSEIIKSKNIEFYRVFEEHFLLPYIKLKSNKFSFKEELKSSKKIKNEINIYNNPKIYKEDNDYHHNICDNHNLTNNSQNSLNEKGSFEINIDSASDIINLLNSEKGIDIIKEILLAYPHDVLVYLIPSLKYISINFPNLLIKEKIFNDENIKSVILSNNSKSKITKKNGQNDKNQNKGSEKEILKENSIQNAFFEYQNVILNGNINNNQNIGEEFINQNQMFPNLYGFNNFIHNHPPYYNLPMQYPSTNSVNNFLMPFNYYPIPPQNNYPYINYPIAYDSNTLQNNITKQEIEKEVTKKKKTNKKSKLKCATCNLNTDKIKDEKEIDVKNSPQININLKTINNQCNYNIGSNEVSNEKESIFQKSNSNNMDIDIKLIENCLNSFYHLTKKSQNNKDENDSNSDIDDKNIEIVLNNNNQKK